MGQPNFWDSSEKAQQVIQQLKPLNGLINPCDDLGVVIIPTRFCPLSDDGVPVPAELLVTGISASTSLDNPALTMRLDSLWV